MQNEIKGEPRRCEPTLFSLFLLYYNIGRVRQTTVRFIFVWHTREEKNMIHSLSGGVLDGDETHTVIKVKTETEGKIGFYLCDEFRANVGDKVVVETRNGGTETGEVLKAEKNVSEKCSPIPVKRALKALKKL